jgi:hypothetical protein
VGRKDSAMTTRASTNHAQYTGDPPLPRWRSGTRQPACDSDPNPCTTSSDPRPSKDEQDQPGPRRNVSRGRSFYPSLDRDRAAATARALSQVFAPEGRPLLIGYTAAGKPSFITGNNTARQIASCDPLGRKHWRWTQQSAAASWRPHSDLRNRLRASAALRIDGRRTAAGVPDQQHVSSPHEPATKATNKSSPRR